MADNKTTTRQAFPEVTGKIVNTVELVAEADYFAITVRFNDKTALNFSIEPCVFAFPVYSDWSGGEETILKEYGAIRSNIQRS